MDEREARRRVREARVARLATLDPNGRLHLVPVCFALDERTLYTAVDAKPKRSRDLQRLRNIHAHPAVCALVDHYEDDWSRLWWVRVRGRARVVSEDAERERAVALLRAKYPQYERGSLDPVVAVDVDEWRGWVARAAPIASE